MKVLAERKIAVLVVVVIAVAATLFGVQRSLTRLSRDLERLFYDGVPQDGYVEPGIDLHLNNYADSALRISMILKGYPELTESADLAISWRRELLDAESISDKSYAFGRLSSTVYMMTQAAEVVDLTPRDEEALSQFLATFNGAEAAIKNSHYSQTVSAEWAKQSVVAKILRTFVSVREPAMF